MSLRETLAYVHLDNSKMLAVTLLSGKTGNDPNVHLPENRSLKMAYLHSGILHSSENA